MHTALILTLDEAYQAQFEALCGELADQGVATLRDEGVPAHVTLAMGEGLERVDYHGLAMPRFPHVASDAVATFGSHEGVYFLTVRPNREMLDCLEVVHHYLQGIPVRHDRFYTPDVWFPHVTVATSVEEQDVLKTMETIRWHIPIEGRALRLELWHASEPVCLKVIAEG